MPITQASSPDQKTCLAQHFYRLMKKTLFYMTRLGWVFLQFLDYLNKLNPGLELNFFLSTSKVLLVRFFLLAKEGT